MKNLFILLLFFYSISLFSQPDSLSYHPMFNAANQPFYHGVAAGDSRSDGFVIWTRVTPRYSPNMVLVKWFVYDTLGNIVQQGEKPAFAEKDYTVKVYIHNLEPWTDYQYQFEALGKKSQIGHIKTTPAKGQKIKSLSLIAFTGSNYNTGFFNAYCAAAKEKPDFVIHTGDYIYEYTRGEYGNDLRPLRLQHEPLTYSDYCTRYSHYRLDTCLQAIHQACGWYIIWDDHEVANDYWSRGAQNHQENEGSFLKRLSEALAAYYDWMPVRETIDTNINRTVNFGDLVTIIFIDTRKYGRDYQKHDISDTNKTMLGHSQLQWLFEQLLEAKKSNVRWIIITQQLMMAPLKINGKILNDDGWDMYPYERRKILRFLYKNDMKNVVFIGGDIHTSWINELYINPDNFGGRKRDTLVSVEFVTPSVTSPSANWFVSSAAKIAHLTKKYSYIRYVDLHRKGFMKLTVYPQKIDVEYYYVKTIKRPDGRYHKGKVWEYRVEK